MPAEAEEHFRKRDLAAGTTGPNKPEVPTRRIQRRFLVLISALTVESCIFAAQTSRRWEEFLQDRFVRDGMLLRGQSVDGVPVERGAWQKIVRAPTGVELKYGFVNFNSDALAVKLKIDKRGLEATEDEFGYRQADLDAMLGKFHQDWDDMGRRAQRAGRSQAQLDADLKSLERDYKKKRAGYLASRGFKLTSDKVVGVDIPGVVGRNAKRLKRLAKVFEEIGTEKRYDSEDVIGAVVAMTQTAIFYRNPPMAEGARRIGGFLPPLEALIRGWGDCDTKTGIAASILTNFDEIKIVGVGVPEHYLMGIYRLPRKGDAFVEYQGTRYVLVEPVGPAWLPIGTVGRETLDALQAGDGVAVEPMTAASATAS